MRRQDQKKSRQVKDGLLLAKNLARQELKLLVANSIQDLLRDEVRNFLRTNTDFADKATYAVMQYVRTTDFDNRVFDVITSYVSGNIGIQEKLKEAKTPTLKPAGGVASKKPRKVRL